MEKRNKIVILILIFLLILTLSACNKKETDVKLKFSEIQFENNTDNIIITANITEEVFNKNDAITKSTFLVSFDNKDFVKEVDAQIIDNVLIGKLALTEENYAKDIIIETYVVVNKDLVFKAEDYKINIYTLALRYKNNNIDNSLANKIYDFISIVEIDKVELEIDYYQKKLNYDNEELYSVKVEYKENLIETVISLIGNTIFNEDFELYINDTKIENITYSNDKRSITYEMTNLYIDLIDEDLDLTLKSIDLNKDKYNLTLSNPNYDYITITITLKDDYLFQSDFVLVINDKNIESSKYKIVENVLTYKFSDPNWSDIY